MGEIYIAIMAGGIGTRFWPQSRKQYPKQFIDVLDVGETLLQSTFRRSLKLTESNNIFVVTNEAYRGIVNQQLPSLPTENILTEPIQKNTAPCLAYINFLLHAQQKKGTLISVPSDHLIQDEAEYKKSLTTAIEFAQQKDSLLTLGIQPTYPHTGYGYIQKTIEEKSTTGNASVHKVKTFTEKPSPEIAKEFISSQEFLWNSGIFIWSVSSGVSAMKKYMPQEADAFEAGLSDWLAMEDHQEEKQLLKRKIFESCRNISIDYALLELAQNVYVVEASFKWNDLGSWASVYDLLNKDERGNVLSGSYIECTETERTLVRTITKNKVVFVDGLKDYIVVDTETALLICKRDNNQKIKQYLDAIKEKGWSSFL